MMDFSILSQFIVLRNSASERSGCDPSTLTCQFINFISPWVNFELYFPLKGTLHVGNIKKENQLLKDIKETSYKET